ncbi:SDR family NAD(P)-dependent oxidoreductase [Martelella mangrovi]|uniref:NAD(P)-dependent dehydrogenase (Short-subunit alcohol dehydrogenase family) n=1 Tax=Martelella mangrovi TaxID=1397477 RepID=A0ABV2ICZ5_9HYPH
MSANFKDKVAIVTAAASGIGRDIVERLAADGARIIGADINEEALAGLKQAFPDVETVTVDVTREADVEAMTKRAVDKFGRIDIALNVAGGARVGYLLDLDLEDWQASVNIGLTNVFLCLKHEGRHMVKRGGGAIVNVASLTSHLPLHAGSAYSSAKAGVEMLTKNAALEFTPLGVRVNAILPGLVQTPRTGGLFENETVHKAYMDRIPMARAGSPREVANAALFLAGDDASYISGTSLVVDGGWEVTGYPDLRSLRGEPEWLKGKKD